MQNVFEKIKKPQTGKMYTVWWDSTVYNHIVSLREWVPVTCNAIVCGASPCIWEQDPERAELLSTPAGRDGGKNSEGGPGSQGGGNEERSLG